jgi:hypothetical protein
MMVDSRLTGLIAIAFTSAGELPAAPARAVMADRSTEFFAIGGALTVGDVLSITATPTSGAPVTFSYTTKTGDNPVSMAAGLLAAFQATTLPSTLPNGGLSAAVSGPILSLYYPTGGWTFSATVSGSASETIAFAPGSACAAVFHVGFGGMMNLIATPAFTAAWHAGQVIVAIFADPDEAAEMRSRVKRAARNGFSSLSLPS